jgi:type IV secretion system protein VirB6
MGFVYYVLIYNWLSDKINSFGMDLTHSLMSWASAVALVLVTLWIMIQGYRMITGQSRESLMAMVTNMTRIVVIVTAATTMGILGSDLHTLLTTELSTDINQLFTGNDQTAAQTIDENLAWTQLALASIDAVQIEPGNEDLATTKSRALLMAGFGTASPPMAAGAMLLLYQFTLALFIGLGPLFILCLIFDQTKDLFRRWLLYGIGTVFSMAALSFVSSIVLQLTLRVSAALWTSNAINNLTGQGAEGLSSQALQQGGLGLLLTVLIISVPPLAANFFQGTMGAFYFNSAFGQPGAARQGPNGQLQSGLSPRSDYPPSETATGHTNPRMQAGGGPLSGNASAVRTSPSSGQPLHDVVKRQLT